MSDKRFIIWDERDGSPRREGGVFMSDGLVGCIGIDNVYLRGYGQRPAGSPEYDALEVGERVTNVHFKLSGTAGVYSIYRVR